MEAMNWDMAKFWLDVAWRVGTVGGIIWAILQSRANGNAKAIDDIKESHGNRLQRHGERILLLEQAVKNAPSHADLEKLYGKIDELVKVAGEQATASASLSAQVKAMNTTVQLLHQHHIGEGK